MGRLGRSTWRSGRTSPRSQILPAKEWNRPPNSGIGKTGKQTSLQRLTRTLKMGLLREIGPVESLWNVAAAMPNLRKPTTWSGNTKVVYRAKCLFINQLREIARSICPKSRNHKDLMRSKSFAHPAEKI